MSETTHLSTGYCCHSLCISVGAPVNVSASQSLILPNTSCSVCICRNEQQYQMAPVMVQTTPIHRQVLNVISATCHLYGNDGSQPIAYVSQSLQPFTCSRITQVCVMYITSCHVCQLQLQGECSSLILRIISFVCEIMNPFDVYYLLLAYVHNTYLYSHVIRYTSVYLPLNHEILSLASRQYVHFIIPAEIVYMYTSDITVFQMTE
jgi:hypothetical protein